MPSFYLFKKLHFEQEGFGDGINQEFWRCDRRYSSQWVLVRWGQGKRREESISLSITLRCSWVSRTYVNSLYIHLIVLNISFVLQVRIDQHLTPEEKKKAMRLHVSCPCGNFDMESPRWWVVPETDDRVDCSLRSRAAESSISMEKIWYHTKHRFNMPIWRVLCQFLDSTTDGLVSAWLSGDPLNHDPCGYTFRTLRGRSRRTWRCLWLRHRSLRTDAGRGRGS